MLSNQALHLVILPTEGCNFRCTYCYEDFRIGRMRPPVVLGIKRFLSRRTPELKHLNLSWFGGEPLLAADVVTDILGHVAGLRERHALSFTSDMTTNAYRLTPERFAELLALDNREFQITLDGTAPEHDRKRKLARGAGTFDVIWSRLEHMAGTDGEFRAVIRLHVDRGNLRDLGRLLDRCGERFSGDARFVFLIRPLSRLGGPNDAALRVLERDESRAPVAALSERAASVGLHLWRPGEAESVCYAARPNSLVIRADGRLGKCTVALANASNDVGRIREDGTLDMDRDSVLPWMRGMWSGDRAELACPYQGMKSSA